MNKVIKDLLDKREQLKRELNKIDIEILKYQSTCGHFNSFFISNNFSYTCKYCGKFIDKQPYYKKKGMLLHSTHIHNNKST